MSDASSGLAERAQALRISFDRSFAEPARLDTTAMADLLAFRAGSQACAMYLSEITGLFAERKITRIPSDAPGLLGVAAFRGAIMPVYSLAILLGHSASETPRWLAVAMSAPIAFAFETFDYHLRVSREAIVPRETGQRASAFVLEFVRAPDAVRPILHLTTILDAIRTETLAPAAGKER